VILALSVFGCFERGAGDRDTATWWASSYETCSRLQESSEPCGAGCLVVRCVDDVESDGADCTSGNAFAWVSDAELSALQTDCGDSWVEYPYGDMCESEAGEEPWDLSISCVR
jgi:hypothetical protein